MCLSSQSLFVSAVVVLTYASSIANEYGKPGINSKFQPVESTVPVKVTIKPDNTEKEGSLNISFDNTVRNSEVAFPVLFSIPAEDDVVNKVGANTPKINSRQTTFIEGGTVDSSNESDVLSNSSKTNASSENIVSVTQGYSNPSENISSRTVQNSTSVEDIGTWSQEITTPNSNTTEAANLPLDGFVSDVTNTETSTLGTENTQKYQFDSTENRTESSKDTDTITTNTMEEMYSNSTQLLDETGSYTTEEFLNSTDKSVTTVPSMFVTNVTSRTTLADVNSVESSTITDSIHSIVSDAASTTRSTYDTDVDYEGSGNITEISDANTKKTGSPTGVSPMFTDSSSSTDFVSNQHQTVVDELGRVDDGNLTTIGFSTTVSQIPVTHPETKVSTTVTTKRSSTFSITTVPILATTSLTPRKKHHHSKKKKLVKSKVDDTDVDTDTEIDDADIPKTSPKGRSEDSSLTKGKPLNLEKRDDVSGLKPADSGKKLVKYIYKRGKKAGVLNAKGLLKIIKKLGSDTETDTDYDTTDTEDTTTTIPTISLDTTDNDTDTDDGNRYRIKYYNPKRYRW